MSKFPFNNLTMAGNITFSMIKPTAIKNNKVGEILALIEKGGFRIVALKKTQLSLEEAKEFYGVHEGKEFFERLITFMTSGPIIPVILEKENAVDSFRKLLGSTNPEEAEEGTIRKLYATSKTENAVHGSDSDENANIEADFFFTKMERF